MLSKQNALPLYRQINARLGEANTQQGLGLLALQEGDAKGAFRQFAAMPALFAAIQARLGLQAAYGYMARAAAAMGEPDRAVLLAGRSLEIGRDVGDRYGQTITLELMVALFQQVQDINGLLAALALRRRLLVEIGDQQALASARERFGDADPAEPADSLAGRAVR